MIETRAIGQAAAMEAILTGEPIPAERAYNLGLVTRLTEPGNALTEALALAGKITEAAPLAAWASRKTSPLRSPSWPQTMPATLLAPPCSSTVGKHCRVGATRPNNSSLVSLLKALEGWSRSE